MYPAPNNKLKTGKSYSKNKIKGFTLIELILSLTVIGLMITYLAPNFGKLMTNSKTQALKAVVKNIELSLENYYLVNQSYPTGDDIQAASLIQTLLEADALSNALKNPYTGQAFSDTDGSGKITYSFDTQMTTYEIKAWGIDNTSIIYENVESQDS